MLSLTKLFYVKITGSSIEPKENIQYCNSLGEGGKEYLVVGCDGVGYRFIFVDDIGAFNYVSIHNARFVKLYEQPTIKQSDDKVELTAQVKAFITNQIKETSGKSVK